MIPATRFQVAPAFLMLAAASCATSPADAPVTQEQLALNPFDSEGDRPGILLTARLAGRLASNGRCITVATADGVATPLWPEGIEVSRRGTETVLVLPNGRGTAVVGRKVSLGGASLPPPQGEQLADFVRRNCPEPYFAVSFVGD